MTQDFSKGKIYKITNDFNDEVYVGSTCDTLNRRFIIHKSAAKRDVNMNRPIYTLINEIGFERFRIDLIEDYPCKDKYELRQREGYYIREQGTLNNRIAGREQKEYNQDIKQHRKEYYEEYYENKKEQIKEQNKKYYEANKEQIKEYREKNKEHIQHYKKEVIICECGCKTDKSHITRHKISQKHNKLMNLKVSQ